MKSIGNKIVLSYLLLGFIFLLASTHSSFAATVGQKLTASETGWQRFDDTNAAITYSPGGWGSNSSASYYNGSIKGTNAIAGTSASFSFYGTKIRIITDGTTTHTAKEEITIDGKTEYFSLKYAAGYQYLSYEKLGLTNGYHNVVIKSTDTSSTTIDAIDIDSTGTIVNYLIADSITIKPGDSQNTINWTLANKSGTSVNIKRATQAGGSYVTIANNLSDASYTDKNLKNGQTYYYILETNKDNTIVGTSNEVSMTPKKIYGLMSSLLDGKVIKPGKNPSGPLSTTNLVTDNNLETNYLVRPDEQSATTTDFLIYDFDVPQTINAFKLKIDAYTDQKFAIGFVDSKGKETLIRYTDGKQGIDNNIYFFPNTMNDVKKVFVWNYGTKNILVSEWDMYGVGNSLKAEGKKTSVYLTWTGIETVQKYTVKRSEVLGGSYTTIGTDVYGLNYNDKSAVAGKTYYYIVEANVDEYTITSNEASAAINTNAEEQTDPVIPPVDPTPPDPTSPVEQIGDRAILTITMNNGLQQEFDLSMTEVKAFVNWYDQKGNGTGPMQYAISKHNNNMGPFSGRKTYVIFNSILTFDIDEYSLS